MGGVRKVIMRIGWIGGMKRMEAQLARLAADSGHALEFHDGDTRGQGAGAIRNLVDRSEFVIILITLNSHGGVKLARQLVRMRNRPSMVLLKCGQSKFRDILEGLRAGSLNQIKLSG